VGVAVKKEDVNEPAPILDEEDEATLAAIDRGILSADQGRVVPWKKSACECTGGLQNPPDHISADNPSAAEHFVSNLC
jgi:hypothetical protein